MNKNGAERLRIEFAQELAAETAQRRDFSTELAHDMVRLDQRIKDAAADHHWLMAQDLDVARDEIMYTRMQVMRKVWRDARA